jgi:hypothetical protein
MNDKRRQRLWRLCTIAAGGLAGLALTPLVIPHGRHQPMLAGIPYTLWMGFVVAILLVVVTWLGTKVHPGEEN